MANKKLTDLNDLPSPAGADILAIVDDVVGTPTTKKVTATNLMTLAPVQSVAGRTGTVTLSNTDISGLGSAATTASTDYASAFYNIVTKTANYTLTNAENGKVIFCNSSSRIDITVPSGLTSGFNCRVVQGGAGRVRFVASSTTINGYTSGSDAPNAVIGQHGVADLVPTGTNAYSLTGDINYLSVFSNSYSVSFDGTDDFLNSDPNITHASVSSYTMSAWVNFTSFSNGGGVYQMRGGQSATDWNYNNFLRVDSATSASYYHRGTGGYQECTYTGVNLSLSNWYNFAQVWDGTNVKLYLDGALISTTTTTKTASFAGRSGYNIKFDLGRGRASNSYPCKIDEFAWWDSDKSSSVSNIYNSGTPSDISSLSPVHWYRMGDNDGGSGTTITDQGSGGTDGTLTNGPTFSTDVP